MVQDVRPIKVYSSQKYTVVGELILNPSDIHNDLNLIIPKVDMEVSTGNTYDITGKQGTLVPANQFILVEVNTDKGAIRLVGNGDVYVSAVNVSSTSFDVFTDITKQIDPTFVGGGGSSPTNLGVVTTESGVTITSSTGTDAVLPLISTTFPGLMTPVEKSAIDGGFPNNLSTTVSPSNVIINASNGTNATIPLVTTVNAGLMSPADKIKLDGVSSGVTNLSNIASPTTVTVVSSTGTDTDLPLATQVNAGLLSPADKIKLDNGGTGTTNLSTTVTASSITVVSDTGTDAVLPLATITLSGLLDPADKVKIDAGFPTNLSITAAPANVTINCDTGTDAVLPVATQVNAGLLSPADKILIDGGFPTNLTNTASPTTVTVESSSGGNTSLPLVDTTNAGLMSPADKTKLDGLSAGGGGATNLASVVTASDITVTSDTGTDAVLPLVTTTLSGLMSPADKSKLDGLSAGAGGSGFSGTVVTGTTQVTISVPTDYATIQAAIDAVDTLYKFQDQSTCVIQLENGTHNVTAPLEPNTTQQDRIIFKAQNIPVDYSVETNLTDTLVGVTASTSSVFNNDTANYGPNNVLDNNTASINHTANAAIGEYVQVDLGQDVLISRVTINNRSSFGTRLNGSVVKLLDATDTVVYTSEVINNAADNSFHTININDRVIARKARVEQTTANFVHISELNVFGGNDVPIIDTTDLASNEAAVLTRFNTTVSCDTTMFNSGWNSVVINGLYIKSSGTFPANTPLLDLYNQNNTVAAVINGYHLKNVVVSGATYIGIIVSNSNYFSTFGTISCYNLNVDIKAVNTKFISLSTSTFGKTPKSIVVDNSVMSLADIISMSPTNKIIDCFNNGFVDINRITLTSAVALTAINSSFSKIKIINCNFTNIGGSGTIVSGVQVSTVLDNGGNINAVFSPAKGSGINSLGAVTY